MNDHELKRLLEAATSARPAPLLADDETKQTAELRSAWQRFSAELSAANEQLNGDGAEFLNRLEQATLAGTSEPAAEPVLREPASPRRAAIVACGRSLDGSEEPLSWKGWLSLVACVALCGSAILWYDFDGNSNNPQQTAAIEPAAKDHSDAIAPQPPAAAAAVASDVATDEQGGAAADSLASIDAAWTDPVDQAIAQASRQLASIENTSRWDRSLAALEQYRDSVEQEMNEWDL